MNYPQHFVLEDFLISNFALLFGMFGLGSAFQDLADTKEVEKSAGRIFYIMDRKSAIDPLGDEGKVLDASYKKPNFAVYNNASEGKRMDSPKVESQPSTSGTQNKVQEVETKIPYEVDC